MRDAAAVMRDLVNEPITPEEQRAWMTWWSQHPEDAKKLMALREAVLTLLEDAQLLAARAARIRASCCHRLLGADRRVLGAVAVEPSDSIH